MTTDLKYARSIDKLHQIFQNCDVHNFLINLGPADTRGKPVTASQKAIYLASPLNDDEYQRLDHAIDLEWLNAASPLRQTTIQISSKDEDVSTWIAPENVAA
jgi:hypothetical protein